MKGLLLYSLSHEMDAVFRPWFGFISSLWHITHSSLRSLMLRSSNL